MEVLDPAYERMNFLTGKEGSVMDDDEDDVRLTDLIEEKKEEFSSKELDELLDDAKIEAAPIDPFPTTMRKSGNTGPKGVLADYAEAKERARLRMAREKEEIWKRIEKKSLVLRSNEGENKKDELDELEDEEDDFFKEYREKRLKQLQSQVKQSSSQNSTQAKKTSTFGYLKTITRREFLDEIDKEDPNTFVVVHLYQDYIKECTRLNKYLQSMAIKFFSIKFLKIISTEASCTYDDIALPTIIVYRGGEIFSSKVRIIDEVGKDFDYDDIEIFFANRGIIRMPRTLPTWNAARLVI